MIIIGAGAAGLAAAEFLSENGCNPLILEARNRTGGRIFTDTMGSTKVDMGASWIHGIGPGAGEIKEWEEKYNPIYTLALRHKIDTV